jgi:hypothetical protein
MAIILEAIDFIKVSNRARANRLASENNQTLEVFALSILDAHLDGKLQWVEDSDLSTSSASGGKIETLDLSTRPYNRLKEHGVDTIEKLCAFDNIDQIIKIKGMGSGSAEEIKSKMDEFGLSFGMSFSETEEEDDDFLSFDAEEEEEEEEEEEVVEEEDEDEEEEVAVATEETKKDRRFEEKLSRDVYEDGKLLNIKEQDRREQEYFAQQDDWDKEDALYTEIRGLQATKESVKRAFEIFKELNNLSDEEARSKASKILVDYDKDDPTTFMGAIEAFSDNLPASREVVNSIVSIGKGANIPEEDINTYNGKSLPQLTMAEAKKKLIDVRTELNKA